MSTSNREPRRILNATSRMNRGKAGAAGGASSSSSSNPVMTPIFEQDIPAPLQLRKVLPKKKMLKTTMEKVAGDGPLHESSRGEDSSSMLLDSKPLEESDGIVAGGGRMWNSSVKTPNRVKSSMRATCEEVLDDLEDANPNVYNSPPAPASVPAPLNIPSKKAKPESKVNTNTKTSSSTQTQYRDIPSSEIDLNPKSPKSPKSPKTDQQGLNTNPNPHPAPAKPEDVLNEKKKTKKKKKKSSTAKVEEKFIPPAIIRDPTPEEKQERMMQNFLLYDNQFQLTYEKIRDEVAAGGTGGESLGLNADAYEELVRKASEVPRFNHFINQPSESAKQFADIDQYFRREFAKSGMQMPREGSGTTSVNPHARSLTEFLQKKSKVQVDVNNAAVGRAQDFWAEPKILGEAGKDLNTTFKAALDRAGGAKIASMAVGGKGIVGAQAGTIFGREEDGPNVTVAGSSKEGKEMESRSPDLETLRRRMVQIKAKALTISYTPAELQFHLSVMFPKPAIDATWFAPSIISEIATHSKLLSGAQPHNDDLVTCTEYNMSKLCPMFHMHDDSDPSKVHILVLWLNGCVNLWRLIQFELLTRQYQGRTGLYKMDQAVCSFVILATPGNRDLKFWEDMVSVLSILSLWFLEEYHWAKGNFDVVVKSAEDVFSNQESLMRALNYVVGTNHLAFPERERVIRNKIAQAAWCEDTEEFTNENLTSKISGYGSEISEILQFLYHVVEGIREVYARTATTTQDHEAREAALNCFHKCAFALWNLVHDHGCEMVPGYENGLGLFVQAVYSALASGNPYSNGRQVHVLRSLTVWFVNQWKDTDGNLMAVNEKALKEPASMGEGVDVESLVIRENGLAEWSAILIQTSVQRIMPTSNWDVARIPLKEPLVRLPSVQQVLADMPKKPPLAHLAPLRLLLADTRKAPRTAATPIRLATTTVAATPTSLLNLTPGDPKKTVPESRGNTDFTNFDRFGDNIPQVIRSLERITNENPKILSGSAESGEPVKLEIISCSFALWHRVKDVLQPTPTSPSTQLRSEPRNGLEMMCYTASTSMGNTRLQKADRVILLMRLSTWFIMKWLTLGKDLEKVKKAALLEAPSGTEDLELFNRLSWTEHSPAGVPAAMWKHLGVGLDMGTSTSVVDDKQNAEVVEAVNKAIEKLQKVIKGTAISEANLAPTVKKKEKAKEITAAPEARLDIPTAKAVEKLQNIVKGSAVSEAKLEVRTVKKEENVEEDMAIPDARIEVPTIKMQQKTEEGDNFDESHESMEYISPSFIPGAPGPYRDAPPAEASNWKVNYAATSSAPQETISAHNQMGSNILQLLAEKVTPAPINNENENANSQQENYQDQDVKTDNAEDDMSNNMAPPTPPMTSAEMSAQPPIVRELAAINNSFAAIKLNLYQVDAALYGQSTTPLNASFTADIDSDDSTEATHDPNTSSRTAGLLVVTDYLAVQLKDAQTQIAGVDSKIGTLSSAIAELHTDNQELKTTVKALNEKMDRLNEDDKDRRNGKMLRELIGEVKALKAEMEMMGNRCAAGEKEKVLMLEKAQELQDVVERAREVGRLSEVLWPQGDGYEGVERARGEVKMEGAGAGVGEKAGKKDEVRRDLYVNVGHQAGRGQGGGGFCVVM